MTPRIIKKTLGKKATTTKPSIPTTLYHVLDTYNAITDTFLTKSAAERFRKTLGRKDRSFLLTTPVPETTMKKIMKAYDGPSSGFVGAGLSSY